MNKRFIAVAIALFILSCAVPADTGFVYAQGAICASEVEKGEEAAEEARLGRDEHSARYDRMMRELEREYKEGSLTRTEYIQRLREIKALGEE